MKNFKSIDFWLQLALIPACILLAIAGKQVFTAYFIVGGWQLMSAVIHLVFRRNYLQAKARGYYTIIAVSLVLLGLLQLAFPGSLIIIYGYFMLLCSPFLALWYICICYEEKRWLEHRAFVHLK